jgi:hypothetical protein
VKQGLDIAQAMAGAEAPTDGWDTVFAIHTDAVNEAIAKAGSSPTKFAVEVTSDQIAGTGTFGAWSVTTGGSDKLINMSLPVPVATLTMPDGSTVTLNDSTVKITVNLEFVANDANANSKSLVVAATAPPGQAAVTVDSVAYAKPKSVTMLQNAVFMELMTTWLNANIGDFNHVFAVVDLNRTADKAAFQWLSPTTVSYAYTDLVGQSGGILAVLCMTEGRSAAGLAQQVPSSAIPSGANAGFLISANRVLNKLILPAMPQVFSGSTAQDFQLSATGDSIENANATATFSVTDSNGDSHTATIQNLLIQMDVAQINFSLTCYGDSVAGITPYCETNSAFAIDLVAQKGGTGGAQTLGFTQITNSVTHWTTESPDAKKTSEILAIISGIILAIATVLTDGLAFIAVALIVGLVSGGDVLTETIVKMAENDEAPSIDSAILNATAPISWAGASSFSVTSASLNSSLQLGGTLSLS